MKICSTCKVEKELSEFYKTGKYYFGHCKQCHNKKSVAWAKANPEKIKQHRRKTKLKNKYAISVDEYDILFKEQNGVCALCGKQHNRRPLNVDHCHTTGKIRGLLCDKCNLGIGLFDDDPTLLQKVQEYLS